MTIIKIVYALGTGKMCDFTHINTSPVLGLMRKVCVGAKHYNSTLGLSAE
jgi:hypothetical protein